MFKSNKTLRTLLCANFALVLFLSTLVFSGCSTPEDKTKKDVDTKATYSINGEAVTTADWQSKVVAKFADYNGKEYGSDSEYGSETLYFTVTSDKELKYNYESTYGSYSGTIISYNNEVEDGNNGFVLLLKTAGDHSNYTRGSCSGAAEDFDDTQAHSCYLPVYFAFTEEGLINGAYYSGSTACFYTKEAALENMQYDSTIYGRAATYPAR